MKNSWNNFTLFYQQVKKNATSRIFENKQVGNRLLKGSGGKNIKREVKWIRDNKRTSRLTVKQRKEEIYRLSVQEKEKRYGDTGLNRKFRGL